MNRVVVSLGAKKRALLDGLSFGLANQCRSSNQQTKYRHTGSIPLAYPIIGGFVITTLGGIKYFHDHVGGTEGLWRSLSFYSYGIPKYFVYRYHMWRESSDEEWERLHHETSHGALNKALELEGFYVKCGQMCASNIGNAFPPIWQDTMSVLQDHVPPQDFSVIRQVIESELDFENTFATFETEPIGSASIGQVHRATLRKDGTPVVVKVCYPNVERLLRGDVRTIKLFAKVAQPVHVPGLEEIEHQFQTEFDYRQEGRNMEIIRNNLTQAGLCGNGKICVVPRPYLEYCTKRVLVMEELSGDKLAVEIKKDVERHYGEGASHALKEMIAAQKAKQQEAHSHKSGGGSSSSNATTKSSSTKNVEAKEEEEPNGASAKDFDLLIALENGKRKLENAKRRLHNLTVGLLPGAQLQAYKDKSELPLNHAKLIDDLIYVHGHEVLVDGIFNGDPHPGNILLCRDTDGSPQLGLIDYGQVKRLSKELRQHFCKIIIALDDDNHEEIIRLMKEAGFRSKQMDEEVIYLYAKVGYDQDNRELTKGMHIQMFMEDLQSRDGIQELPRDFISISRMTLILRGLAHALHQSRSIASSWRPIAERVLREDL